MRKILEKSKSCGTANIRGSVVDAISASKRDSRSFSILAEEVIPAEIHSETYLDIGIIPGSVWWSRISSA